MAVTPRLFCAALIALAPLTVLCIVAAANPNDVGCSTAVAGCDSDSATTTRCDGCSRAVCYPKTEQVDEEKTCRIVKCEKVAVPAITLPWEQGGSPLTLFNCLRQLAHSHDAKCRCDRCSEGVECCDACCCDDCSLCGPTRCGTVRAVHVLDEEKNDVKKCETTWEIGYVPACGQCGHCPHCCK